jgi:hypothetical protein
VVVATENGILELSVTNIHESHVITDARSAVCCMQLVDPAYLAIGTLDGYCILLRRTECWNVVKRFHHNDKPITDFVMIETSLCVSSEDRKLTLININSGLIESQVLM